MADTKISALSDLAGAQAAGDLLVLVDISDITMAASGTNKKNTWSSFLASTTDALTGTNELKAITANSLAAIWEKGGDVASSGTISLGEGGYFHITGTTPITDIDFATATNGRVAYLVFDGILTLTHHGTTLILPGAVNITTAANDRACFVQDAADNVYCLWYERASGMPLIGGIIDADKGDITVSSSGTVFTIDANVVTNAKSAQMAANTWKANNTTSTANVSDITDIDARTALLLNSLIHAAFGGI